MNAGESSPHSDIRVIQMIRVQPDDPRRSRLVEVPNGMSMNPNGRMKQVFPTKSVLSVSSQRILNCSQDDVVIPKLIHRV